MSETSRRPTARRRPRPIAFGSKRDRREIESWLAAEAQHDVPAAEEALFAVFEDRRSRRRSALADRIMAVASAEGTLRRPWWGRYALVGATLGVWIASLAGIATLGSVAMASSNWVVGGLTKTFGALADGVRVAQFGWDLVRGLQQALLTLLAAPDVTAWIALSLSAAILSCFWLGRLLAADASDARTGRLETA